MTSASHERRRRQQRRIEASDHEAWVASGGGKRTDESGSFTIDARTYRTDPWERAALIRLKTPPGAVLSKPVYVPILGGYEFEWHRTLFALKDAA